MRIKSPLGMVKVHTDTYGIHKDLHYRWLQAGHVWDKGFLVTVERWKDQPMPDGTLGWSDWKKTLRSEERVRPAPSPTLPPMTEEEKDAWADYVFLYFEDAESVTTSHIARSLPGWDDTTTFTPRRIPDGNWQQPLLWEFMDSFKLAHVRAQALASMSLRRLVKQGRVVKFSDSDRWGKV